MSRPAILRCAGTALLSVVAGVAGVTSTIIAPAAPARAAARPVGGQAPAYYRMHIGRYEVTALLDGTHPFPAEKLAVGAKPGQVNALLAEQDLPSPFEGMINAFLVNLGDKLILIDTGAGNLYGKDGGGLVGAIQAAGYAPDKIDDICFTAALRRSHHDHRLAVVAEGAPQLAERLGQDRNATFSLDTGG